MKQWKYIKGSEKDFEGAPDWALSVCRGTFCLVFCSKLTGKGRWQNKGNERETGYDDLIGLPVIAQRELIEVRNGEELPPVGTVCQWDNGENDWCDVKIMGISDGELWVKPLDGSQSFVVCDGDFRPLPDERDLAVKEMASTPKPCGFAIQSICEQLYDAGYRKYSAKPGFEWRYVCSTCGCKVEPGEELPHGC